MIFYENVVHEVVMDEKREMKCNMQRKIPLNFQIKLKELSSLLKRKEVGERKW